MLILRVIETEITEALKTYHLMKRLNLLFCLVFTGCYCLSICLSSAQTAKKAALPVSPTLNETPSWELGTDVMALTNLSFFPVPKYSIFVRRNIITDRGLRGIRGKIGLSIDNAFESARWANDDINEWYVRGGYEWQKPILKRYKLFYGIDAHYFARRVNPSRAIGYISVFDQSPYFSGGEKVDQWGVDPFIGFKAYLFSCLSVSIETGMTLSYKESNIRYFSLTQDFLNNTKIERRLLLQTIPLSAFNVSFEF